jgi:catechol 2,3-dioxygenase-like lactoylglutathione lyase family enzyme
VQFNHVGVVVENMEQARDRLTELLGVRWGPIREARVPSGGGDGDERVTLRVCFSTEEPGIELLEEVPGTVWTCNSQSNLHHISFFVDSVLDESRRLDRAHCPLEYVIDGNGGPTLAYHIDALGVRVELVTTAVQTNIEQHRTLGAAS